MSGVQTSIDIVIWDRELAKLYFLGYFKRSERDSMTHTTMRVRHARATQETTPTSLHNETVKFQEIL